MSGGWEDLVTRARGLSGRLLGRSRLTEIAQLHDLVQLAAALEEAYGPAAGVIPGASAEQLEISVRRGAARHLRIIAHWCGKRADFLAALFLDEDRRSVRALLRGAIAGAPPAERLAGLIPTPELPERALEELARQSTANGVVALLALWGHPFGSPLLVESRRAQPDLFRLELLLNTAYATISADAAKKAPLGDAVRRDLLSLVRDTIDLENAATVLQLAGQRFSTDPGQLFVPAGGRLDRTTFLAAASAKDAAAAAAVLARAFHSTPFASVFAAGSPKAFEDAALSAELRHATSTARRSPLGAAPLIAFAMRLRAEVRDLQRIIWGIALGAPPPRSDALVTTV